jgi:homoserine O-succinyltransferase
MPIKVPNDLPVRAILEKENIFVMDENRAIHQDIRPIQILILNLMPIKEDTELQILRELSNTPLQIDCTFMRMRSHDSKNTSKSHLDTFYVTFDQIKRKHYDGMIVTGAPVELYEFEDVDYWDEISQIFSWINTHVTSTIYLCWAAQAAMYYYYGLQKKLLEKKMFGLFQHKVFNRKVPLVRGFDDQFLMPHSRYTDVPAKDIANCPELTILAQSKEAGVFLCMAENGRKIFVTGHPEYGRMQLRREYERDKKKGIEIDLPKNYFPDDDPGKRPPLVWRAHANNLYTNWLNYYVYQSTPYDLDGTPWGDEIPDNYSEKRVDEK